MPEGAPSQAVGNAAARRADQVADQSNERTLQAASQPAQLQLAAQPADAAADLQQRWLIACPKLAALPKHARFAQLPPYSAAQLQTHNVPDCSKEVLQGCASRAEKADLVVQIALQAPDAHYTRTQTLLARADCTLAELSDAVQCANDRHARDALGHDVSGGLFYFNGVLYVDDRTQGQPGHVDYATSIQKFLAQQAQDSQRSASRELARRKAGGAQGPFAAAPQPPTTPCRRMADVQLGELSVSIAKSGQYLYVHAGACEHIVVFEDVRWQHADDPDVSAGPASVPFRQPRLEKCCICSIRPAVKVTFDDVLAPESPAFFCVQCFDDLHFDAQAEAWPEVQELDVYEVYE